MLHLEQRHDNLPVKIGQRMRLKIIAHPIAAVAFDVFFEIAFETAKTWSVKKSTNGRINGIRIKNFFRN